MRAGEVKQAGLRYKEEARLARESEAAAKREAGRATAEAEQRRVQLAVMMETVETLQAGSQGGSVTYEKDLLVRSGVFFMVCVINLTAILFFPAIGSM